MNSCRKLKIIPLLYAILAALVACNKPANEFSDNGICNITVSCLSGTSINGLTRGLTPEQEAHIDDVNIYAVNPVTGIVRHTHLYTSFTSFSLPSGVWEFYVFANLGYDMGDRSEQDLKALTAATDTENALAEDGRIRMSLHKTVDIAGNISLHLKLVRMAAKVQVGVEVVPDMAGRLEIRNIQICRVPASVRYFGDNDAVAFADYVPQKVAGSTFARTFYLPENLAGTVTEITQPQERSIINAPADATCVVIEALCDGRAVTYYVYPGGNETSDFNIRRNHDYILNVTLCGANPEDIRLATYDLTLADTEGRANVGSAFDTTLDFAAINLKGDVFRFSFRSLKSGCNVSVDGQAVAPGSFATLTAGISASRSFEIQAESAEAGTAQIEFTVSNGRGEKLTRTLTIEFLVPEQIDISPTYSYGLTAKELSSVTSELHASVSFSILVSKPLPAPLTIEFNYRWGSKYTNGDIISDNRHSYTFEAAAGVMGSGVELFNGDKHGEPCPVYNSNLGYYTRHGYTMLSGGSLYITYLSDPPPGYMYNLKPVNVVYRNPVYS